MRQWVGDMRRLFGRRGAICVTTNGFVKANGACVMGRGIAKTVATTWPKHRYTLGDKIKENGNIVQPIFRFHDSVFIAFPVKPITVIADGTNTVSHMSFVNGQIVPGWAAKADINLIRDSFGQLITLADREGWEHIALPLPGCGAGELSWKNDIKPIVEALRLDDRFIFCSFKEEDFER